MRIVIYGQMQPNGPVAPLITADGATAVELNTDIAAKLRELAAQFDPAQPAPSPVRATDPAFEDIVRRYHEETGDGPAADL